MFNMSQTQASFSLFQKADLDGFLEKISSGITSKLISSKTKVWCELRGPILHVFKESKRMTGAQQNDMRQIQIVRKVTSDKTGCHFEVVSKTKTQTFQAPTAADCNLWIQHLQRAMTLKDVDTELSPNESPMVSIGDYESVLPLSNTTVVKSSAGSVRMTESGYAEIGFMNSPNLSGPEFSHQAAGNIDQSSCKEHEESSTKEENAYAVVEFTSEQLVEESNVPSIKLSASDAQETNDNHRENDSPIEAKVNENAPSAPSQTASHQTDRDAYGYTVVAPRHQPQLLSVEAENEDLSEEDKAVLDVLENNRSIPITPFPYPLRSVDQEPLNGLKEFLSSNRKICRPSFHDRISAEDPVEDLKKLLTKICSC